MADIVSSMIGIDDLNDLIQNQYRVFAWLDDRPELREEEPSIFPEENTRYIDIDDHPWSYSLLPREIEFTCRETGKTVILNRRQRSPFEFSTRSLLRFLLTKYEEARFPIRAPVR